MGEHTGIFVGLGLFALILLDVLLFGGANLVFFGRKLLKLVEYIAFWR